MSAPNVLQISDAAVRPAGPESPLVLQGFTLSVFAGEIVALVGPSGAGKTTALRAAAGLLTLEEGTVRAPKRLGYLPQHPLTAFDPRWSVLRSVTEPALLAGAIKGDALEKAKRTLESLRLSDMLWERRPAALSGGQLRRAAIARALAADPGLILADEPTAGLDPVATLQLVDLFHQLTESRDPGVLWVTHDLGVAAAVAERVLVLEGGRIVESATMEQLAAQPRSETARSLLESWLPLDVARARSMLAD